MVMLRLKTANREVEQVQTNVARSLNPLLANPLLNGHIIKTVSLINGTNKIPHGLGRQLIGWIIVRQFNLASIYDQQQTTPSGDGAQFLTLVSNAAATIDVYVF